MGIRPGINLRRDFALWFAAGATRIRYQAAYRAERQRGATLSAPADAWAHCIAGSLLFSGALRCQPVCCHVRTPIASAPGVLRRSAANSGYICATSPGSNLVVAGRGTSPRGAGRGGGGSCELAIARRKQREQLHFGERRASDREARLLPESVSGLDRHHEDYVERW